MPNNKTQYRVVTDADGRFQPQRRWLCFWLNIGFRQGTLESAKSLLERYKSQKDIDRENAANAGKVVHEE